MTAGARQGTTIVPCPAERGWSHLLTDAQRHGVLDLLLAPLERLAAADPNTSPVPKSMLESLRVRRVEATAQNLKYVTQLVQVLDLLARHGVRALAFKGPAFAAGILGDLGRRTSSDLDLLIDLRHAAVVRRLLLLDGYRLPPRRRYFGGALLHGVYRAAGRDDTMWPGQAWQAPLDVHVAFAHWTTGIRTNTEDLFRRSVTVHAAGVALPTVGPDDLLVVLAVHGLMHGWAWLRLVADVEAVAAHVGDWDMVMERAVHARAQRAVKVALRLIHTLLQADLPVRVVEWCRADARVDAIVGQVVNGLHQPAYDGRDFDPYAWFLSFQERPLDRWRFQSRSLMYEWLLKWPWDEWLGRRVTDA